MLSFPGILSRLRAGPTRGLDRAPVHPFDLYYGVDTSGTIALDALARDRGAESYAECAFGIPPSLIRYAFGRIAHPQHGTLIDLGCGKGRVAIIASEYGFRRVIGVEMSPRLACIALHNASLLAQSYPDRPRVEIALGDATCFPLPPGPLVLFLSKQVPRPIFRLFLRRLADSRRARPRRILFLYVKPRLARLLDGDADFRRLSLERVPIDPAELPFKSEREEWVGLWECIADRK